MSTRQCDDFLDTYMAYTDNTEACDLFRLWTAIFCIAACLKRKCSLPWGTLTFFPNIYVVLVAPSGFRKGTAMGPGYSMLSDLNVKMAAEATTREALIRELKKAGDDPVISGTHMEFHSSLTIFSQELSVFLGYNNIQLMSDLTDWYDCRSRWHYSTKDKALSDDIINVWVSLFGATTPSMIQSSLPSDAVGLGLTSRIIFIFENRKGKCCPFPGLTQAQEEMRPKLLSDLEQIHLLRGKFTYTSRFMSDYIDWYVHQENNKPFSDERLAGYVMRRPGHLLKLCMILNVSRTSSMQITDVDLRRAVTILEVSEKKMPRVFSGFGKSPLASAIHRAMMILAAAPEIEYDKLFTMLSADVRPSDFEQVVIALEKSRYAKVEILGKRRIITKLPTTQEGNIC